MTKVAEGASVALEGMDRESSAMLYGNQESLESNVVNNNEDAEGLELDIKC